MSSVFLYVKEKKIIYLYKSILLKIHLPEKHALKRFIIHDLRH